MWATFLICLSKRLAMCWTRVWFPPEYRHFKVIGTLRGMRAFVEVCISYYNEFRVPWSLTILIIFSWKRPDMTCLTPATMTCHQSVSGVQRRQWYKRPESEKYSKLVRFVLLGVFLVNCPLQNTLGSPWSPRGAVWHTLFYWSEGGDGCGLRMVKVRWWCSSVW